MVITDMVYNQIQDQIALHPPERGGALYGPVGHQFITHFEFDHDGKTSSVSYVPSSRLIESVPRVETETGLQFKGVVHSHPHGFARPSGGDELTVESFFRLNPHFSVFALPIVQMSDSGGEDRDFLYWFRAERRKSTNSTYAARSFGNQSHSTKADVALQVITEDYYVVPLAEHVKRVTELLNRAGLNLTVSTNVQPLTIQNADLVGLVAKSEEGHEFLFFVSAAYPIVAPLVLFQRHGNSESLPFQWNGISVTCVEESLSKIASALRSEWSDPSRPSMKVN